MDAEKRPTQAFMLAWAAGTQGVRPLSDSEVPVVVFCVLGLADDIGGTGAGEEVMVHSHLLVRVLIIEF